MGDITKLSFVPDQEIKWEMLVSSNILDERSAHRRESRAGNVLVELVNKRGLDDLGLLRCGSRTDGRVRDIEGIGLGAIDPIVVGGRGDVHSGVLARGR